MALIKIACPKCSNEFTIEVQMIDQLKGALAQASQERDYWRTLKTTDRLWNVFGVIRGQNNGRD